MATYQFGSITSAEAAGYNAGSDDLQFTGIPGATATNLEITVNNTLRVISTGASVALGSGARGEILTLADGSIFAFPRDGAVTLSGGSQGDRLYGSLMSDRLSGLAGDDILDGGRFFDTLAGGQGADTLSGGSESDSFELAPGDSGVTEGRIDLIRDWEAGDIIRLTTPITGGDYEELTATSYAAALQAANQRIATGAIDVAVVRVGADVFVFADTKGDNGGADDAIRLSGRTLDDVFANSVSGYTPVAAPPPTTPGPPSAPPVGALTFETISAADALAYNAAANDLRFSSTGAGHTVIAVSFESDGTVLVTSGAGLANQTVRFGAGIYGETNLIFAGFTRVVLGSLGADMLVGAGSSDGLWGGPGEDTLNGGGNPDLLYGGTGSDLFVVAPGDTTTANYDTVRDWESIDRITFGGPVGASAANYVEFTGFTTLAEAQAAALQRINSGAVDYVAAQVGANVFVFADAAGHNVINGRIQLAGVTLANVDFANIVASPVLIMPTVAPLPGTSNSAAPGPVSILGVEAPGGGGNIEGDMDRSDIGAAGGANVDSYDATALLATSNTGLRLEIVGRGFTYRETATTILDMPTGVIDRLSYRAAGLSASLDGLGIPATLGFNWAIDGRDQEALSTLLKGADILFGSPTADLIRGLTGSDTLKGLGGSDTLWGGQGNDVVYATNVLGFNSGSSSDATYLRGEEGDDWIAGGDGFDDINGNQGNDTAGGGLGDDWVVGGKDNDFLFGDAGNDLVYGNLGADTCEGGAGNDTVRGGQDNDVVRGGAGNDFLSGDRGDDTMSGGAGADVFNTFAETGTDRVLDFNLAEGDRVQLAPGTTYSLAQVGADTVISMTGGGQLVLVGVAMSSLTGGWIFGA